MKRYILFVRAAFVASAMALCLSACSDEPADAVSKHVYSDTENVYLRTDASATVSLGAEFRKGHIAPKTFSLKDYAEQIQTKTGMTVDDLVAGVDAGKVAFKCISTARAVWLNDAPGVNGAGWWFDASGAVSDQEKGVATVELDKAARALVVTVPEDAAAGVAITANVGFAVINGTDYDRYVRFNVSVSVTDPGTVIKDVTIPAGDYASYELEFPGVDNAIQACFGMTSAEFMEKISDPEGPVAMYIVDEKGNWDKASQYTAGGIGYWMDKDNKVTTWKGGGWNDGNMYFIETHTTDGGNSVGIGRAPNVPSGTTTKAHFVYADKTDNSKFIEFVLNLTFE